MKLRKDGTGAQVLTPGSPNAGFPSWSPDGKHIVFRVWTAKEMGLRILDLEDQRVRVLTTDYDNVPFWSPRGDRILFTRKLYDDNPKPYAQIFIMKADGSEQTQLTDSRWEDAMPRLLPKTKALPTGLETTVQTAKTEH